MGKNMKYAFLIFLSKPKMYLFISFEMIILLIAVNISVGQYNSRKILYDPIKPYIEQQGFFTMETGISVHFETGEVTETESTDLNELFDDTEIITIESLNFPQYSNV